MNLIYGMNIKVPQDCKSSGAGGNYGGSVEVVVPINGAKLESFHTIKF